MMKNLLLIAMLAISICGFAQVGLNTVNPQGSFHIDGAKDNSVTVTPTLIQQANDFVVLPNGNIGIGTSSPTTKLQITGENPSDTGLKFTNITSNTIPSTGALLGINATGDIVVVTGNSANTGFDNSTLGYDPVTNANKVTVATAPGGAAVTLLGCKQNPANGHYYCAYRLTTTTNSYNTFSFAKAVGGYVVTLTNNAERTWVNNQIVSVANGYGLIGSIWLGYRRVDFPGNPSAYQWITNENWSIDWTTSPTSTVDNWFETSPAQPSNTKFDSTYIVRTTVGTQRKWYDITGTYGSESFTEVIVEFNE